MNDEFRAVDRDFSNSECTKFHLYTDQFVINDLSLLPIICIFLRK